MQSQINSLKGEFKNEIQNTMKTQQTVLMEQQNAFQNNLQNMLSGFFRTNPQLRKKLSLPELTPTQMTLELADRYITRPKAVAEDVFVKVGKFHFLTDFEVMDSKADPRVPHILGRSFLRIGHDLSVNQIDIIDVAREEYAQGILGFSNNSLGGNPTSTSEPILFDSSPSLTSFEGSDFILEEIDAYLKDESISPEIDHANCDPEGDICLIGKLLNNDMFQLPPIDLKQGEVVKVKSSIEEPPKLELKDLPSHLKYAYLEGVDKLPVIIAKDLKVDEKEALLKVLKSYKMAIAWKIIDIKGIDPRFCTHKTLMEEDYKPTVKSQSRVNPKIHEVIKKEVIKLLDVGMIYSISDSSWEFDIIIRDKKGTENLAAANFFRFENPHKDVFKNKDINENFPLETLGKISSGSTPWFADFANFHAGNFSVKGMSSQQKKKFFKDLLISSKLVMKDPPGAIMVPISLPRKYILVAVDYFSKLVKVKVLLTNDARDVVKFLKSLFARFGTPRAIISDRGTHVCNDKFAKVMSKYGVTHRLATAYHAQTSGQVEVSNRGLKRILERTVGENRASWSEKLEDDLWAFRTAYKTPIGCTPYKLVYGKSCHLPI
nr:reverse transcriptase domain-containing protein [Tanacetum cinerariifolium]